jgi:hypothetical protein
MQLGAKKQRAVQVWEQVAHGGKTLESKNRRILGPQRSKHPA